MKALLPTMSGLSGYFLSKWWIMSKAVRDLMFLLLNNKVFSSSIGCDSSVRVHLAAKWFYIN